MRAQAQPTPAPRAVATATPVTATVSETKTTLTTTTTTPTPQPTTPGMLRRRDSFTTLSTVVEETEAADDRSDTASVARVSLFSQDPASIVLPDAPTDVPAMLIPAKNPKLYHLVQMSGEGSFWWDSTESNEPGELGHNFARSPPASGRIELVDDDGNVAAGLSRACKLFMCD